jgi:hypothetical protein
MQLNLIVSCKKKEQKKQVKSHRRVRWRINKKMFAPQICTGFESSSATVRNLRFLSL